MNDQNPTEDVAQTETKPRIKDRILRRTDAPADAESKPKSTIAQKAKNAAAVVGVVTVVGVAAAAIAKKKSAKLEVTLPDVDLTTQDA